MKPGHKKKFPVAIQKAREEMKEIEEKQQREKAALKREKELAQELAEELAKIERDRKLAEARDEHTKITGNPLQLASVDDGHKAQQEDVKPNIQSTATESQSAPEQLSAFTMPPGKEFGAFISHKKVNSTHTPSDIHH